MDWGLSQEMGIGDKLRVGGMLEAFPNPQSLIVFFNLHFFNFLIFTTNID